MTAPQTLARPLAARVAALPTAIERDDNPLVSPAVMQAAADAMAAGHTHYTDRPGIYPLRAQVVAALGADYGIELGADEVTITCGAQEGRFVVLRQLTKPSGAVLCAGDGMALAAAAHLSGVHLTNNPATTEIQLLYLTPADALTRVTALLEQAVTHGWWVVWDTAVGTRHAGFHPAQNPALIGKTITLGEVAALPGWRVGWLAGSQAANKLRSFKQSMTICSPSVSQWAALALPAT